MKENRRNIVQRWRKIYLSAEYEVIDPQITIFAEKENPGLDRWLDEINVSSWAFITAVNPGSNHLSFAENIGRNRQLAKALESEGFKVYPAKGVDPDKRWPDEPAYLVLDIGREQARDFGNTFGQNAIIYGEKGRVSELIWCG